MKKNALIVAGGSGLRMGSTIPKQFLLVKGRPILMHSIERFHQANIFDSILVVLPQSELTHWEKLKQEYSFVIPHKVVAGGSSRFESVKNGLNEIPGDEGYIAIHDGVRPMVSTDLIKHCMNKLNTNTNAIPAILIADSIRKIENDSNEIIDRNSLRAVQTPQCFHLGLIKKAYSISIDNSNTDDACVFESAGNKIHLIAGEKSNLKITVPTDLLIAEALLN